MTRTAGRVARLLDIGELEARVVIAMVAGGDVTAWSLQTDFGLSPGGAAALKERLERERLVRAEPDPECPRSVRLRLSDGAQLEVEAALAALARSPGGPAAVDEQAGAGHQG